MSKVKFENAKFTTDYSFSSVRLVVRILSDAFSKQFCDTKGAISYAAQGTKGRCLYCGKPMYKLEGDIPVFSNTINYDHIYPASRLNLFEVGNVGISCETCNLAKSNRMPMEYYDIRSAEGNSLLIYDREDFKKFLENYTKPYREKWPKHFEAAFLDLNDEELKEKCSELLYNHISLASSNIRYNHEYSVNWDTWKLVIELANSTYTQSTAKDVEGRIGYTNELFEEMFGSDKYIKDCTIEELGAFTDKLLLSKYESKNEVQKYRMLIKMLIEVLNNIMLNENLSDFYSKVPTYNKINKKQ